MTEETNSNPQEATETPAPEPTNESQPKETKSEAKGKGNNGAAKSGPPPKKGAPNSRRRNRPQPAVFPDRGVTTMRTPIQAPMASNMGMDAATNILDPFETKVGYLYHFTAKRLKYSTPEERIESLQELIDTHMKKTLNPELLAERIAKVEQQLESVGFDFDSLYADAQNFHGSIQSPRGKQLLEIIVDIDRYEAMRAAAWLHGLISDKHHASEYYRYKRALEKFYRAIERMSDRARERNINPLVDSGSIWGWTRAQLQERSQKGQKGQGKGNGQAKNASDSDSASRGNAEAAPEEPASEEKPAKGNGKGNGQASTAPPADGESSEEEASAETAPAPSSDAPADTASSTTST
ncbi:hypothetical protein [Thioalkalivibrio sp. ALE19]|uniref:hypothetical protein n=1 Tax=Thioalkalivibrio sp. ALE19 TaxID=1266909 RepID=UPI00041AAFDC|nr:hypothetical protein [Thioalkalivibrio sp. ALE19]